MALFHTVFKEGTIGIIFCRISLNFFIINQKWQKSWAWATEAESPAAAEISKNSSIIFCWAILYYIAVEAQAQLFLSLLICCNKLRLILQKAPYFYLFERRHLDTAVTPYLCSTQPGLDIHNAAKWINKKMKTWYSKF